MRFANGLLALVTLVSAGCSLIEARAPRPESVQPGSAPEGERTEITIRGSDFYLEVQASYVDRERSYLRDTFTARLGEVGLEEVTYVDFHTLTAVVPGTLPEGRHDLVVQDPAGREGVLPDAFEVLPPVFTGGCDPENVAPDDATCDGVDDDCDGETDEDYASTPASCGEGACAGNAGEVACADGVTEDTCDPFEGAALDDPSCDGVDDDCDGETDEDFEATATSCGQGACTAAGELDCVDGELVESCSAGEPASDDPTCDGVDDDCDGETDEDYGPVATSCGVGACQGNTGEIICADGVTEDNCDPLQGAAADDASCNGVDDDCDGETDEDYVSTPTSCGVGACAATGELACLNGTIEDTCIEGSLPADDDPTCDGIDDDCDGSTDEDYASTPTSCGVGACEGNTGNLICGNGTPTDTCDPYGGAVNENEPSGNCLDAIDNDCDGLTDGDDSSCGIVANTPPIAAIYVDPPAGTTATTFQADADGSTDHEDGALLTYLWDWDNDGVTDDQGVTSSHTFSGEGAHTVTLIVQDSGGLRGYATFEVIVASSTDLITVTTELAEQDSGATPSSPGGTGLSLQEAILYANTQPGRQTVFVPSGYVIAIADALPNSTDASGLDVIGDGAALDGSATNPNEACVQFNASDTRFYGFEIFNCNGYPVQFVTGNNNRVARCYIHDNGDEGIFMAGSGSFFGPDNEVAYNTGWGIQVAGANIVEFNRFHHNGNGGIFLAGGAAGSTARGNTVYQNSGIGIFIVNLADDSVVVHNTIHDNTTDGVNIGPGTGGIDFRNNIMSQNGGWGLNANESYFLVHDYNDYYLNVSGTCSGCSGLGADSMTDDPLYVDPAGLDLRLRSDSTLIDQAVVIPGLDLNRAEPGDYNGSAPDIGAWEAP